MALRHMDPRQQAALALGSVLLLADLVVLLVTGEFNVALGGAGVSIFGLAFTLPRDHGPEQQPQQRGEDDGIG